MTTFAMCASLSVVDNLILPWDTSKVAQIALVISLMTLLFLFVVVAAHPSHNLTPCDLDANVGGRPPPPPGPKGYPVIGSLHLLAKHPSPWQVFVELREAYGDVFRIVLGNTECVVVSSVESIREVLLQKADLFSGRPNFLRYHALFGGSRDRSLALCDWSKTQRLRRRLAMPYVFPRLASVNFETLEAIIDSDLSEYFQRLAQSCDGRARSGSDQTTTTFDKAHFSQVTANIFFTYFCTKHYSYEDAYFRQMVHHFDAIFHDINGGFALDFLPWLLPFYLGHLYRLYGYGQFIRHFLVATLVSGWSMQDGDFHRPPQDFLDLILMRTDPRCIKRKSKRLTSDYALYELEDILGGHTAVSCFWARLLVLVAPRPDVQRAIQDEVDSVLSATGDNAISLKHRSMMPYLQAVVLETLRITTSPIVPHVATEDTTISGYHVKKDTLVFINNYYLNRNAEHWPTPEKFDPHRFLTEGNRQLLKPDHFMPFGLGKRSCMGYQLLQSITFLATANLLRQFDVLPPNATATTPPPPVEPAKLSVYDDSVRVVFRRRFAD